MVTVVSQCFPSVQRITVFCPLFDGNSFTPLRKDLHTEADSAECGMKNQSLSRYPYQLTVQLRKHSRHRSCDEKKNNSFRENWNANNGHRPTALAVSF